MAQPRQQKRRSRQRRQSSTTCLSSSSATQRRRRSPSRWPTLSSGRGEQRRQSKPAGSSTCRAAQPSAMALAQLLAVKRRAERALQHIGRCTDELAAHHRPKVARGARSRPGRTTPASLCTQLLVYKMPPIPLNCLKKLLRSHRIGFFSLQGGGARHAKHEKWVENLPPPTPGQKSV